MRQESHHRKAKIIYSVTSEDKAHPGDQKTIILLLEYHPNAFDNLKIGSNHSIDKIVIKRSILCL